MNRQQLALLLTITLALNAACARTKPASSPAAATPTVTVVSVLSQELNRQLRLPGVWNPCCLLRHNPIQCGHLW